MQSDSKLNKTLCAQFQHHIIDMKVTVIDSDISPNFTILIFTTNQTTFEKI